MILFPKMSIISTRSINYDANIKIKRNFAAVKKFFYVIHLQRKTVFKKMVYQL